MNGSLLLGSRDATNTRIEQLLGKEVIILFGLTYKEQKTCNNSSKNETINSIAKVILQEQIFGPVDPLIRDHIEGLPTRSAEKGMFVQQDFDSYVAAQDKIDQIFRDDKELCRRSLTALAKCGDLSCDKSIVSFCQEVWNMKAVEVPNPSMNPVQRLRSHSHLHLQESGSLEPVTESYHSNMFDLAENGRSLNEQNSQESSRGESLDKIYRQTKKEKDFD
mmetsp:Transcript_32841/g.50181  ORF Transcript_32841/g.50181 Transcript_32841/m.50181 type:complete len:220 (+) Transcript_32841:2366-3025(+)